MKKKYTYYTCRELINRYHFVRLWRWNESKIGVFYQCLLLDGRKFGKNSKTIITEDSFEKLIDYVKSSSEISDPYPDYYSYQEVIDEFPQTTLYRWSPTTIGFFYHSGLLQGKKSVKEGKNLVSIQSVFRLIEFTNQRFHNIAHGKI